MMNTQKKCGLLASLLFLSLACTILTPKPQNDTNAFNTMVAQTAQAQPPLIPPAITALPTAIPLAFTPTNAGPSIITSGTLSLPRHNAVDLDQRVITGSINSVKNAPPNIDLVFYAPYADQPDWQFLYPVNNTLIAFGGFDEANFFECEKAFSQGQIYGAGQALEAFPLDSSIFVAKPGKFHCIITDKGKVGAMQFTSTGNYIGMQSLDITYTIWDSNMP